MAPGVKQMNKIQPASPGRLDFFSYQRIGDEMANEIQVVYTTGKNLYALVRNTSGQVWNGNTFVTYNSANLGTYAIALTEQGTSGYYSGDFPAGITTAGLYAVTAYKRAGGSPAEGDAVAAGGNIPWQGLNNAYTDERAAKLDSLDLVTGPGEFLVDHNSGGTNNLSYFTTDNAGIDDATIYVYLKSDYDANNRTEAFIVCQTKTVAGGTWAHGLMLDPGQYTLLYFKQQAYGPDIKNITVANDGTVS